MTISAAQSTLGPTGLRLIRERLQQPRLADPRLARAHDHLRQAPDRFGQPVPAAG
jgi:hypothetical protein